MKTNGTAKTFPSPETLIRRIAALPLRGEEAPPRLPHRLRGAVQRMREHLCGRLGVKAAAVSDAHVAAFARRVCGDGAYLYEHFPGVGFETRELLARWAEQHGP